MQGLLDAGLRKSVIARKMGIHHSYISRIIKKFDLEDSYIPYEDWNQEPQSSVNFEWLVEEDLLENALMVAFDDQDVILDEFFGEEQTAVSMYVKERYESIKDYVVNKDHLYVIDRIKRQCTKCGEVKTVAKFIKDGKSSFGLRPNCYDCINLKIFNRKAETKHLPHDLTAMDKRAILARFDNSCCLTGEMSDIHFDHVIPLKIGRGGTTFGNIIPLHGPLNISKNKHNVFEWFETSKERFNLSEERFNEVIKWLASVNGLTEEEYKDFVYWCHDNPIKKEAR